MWQTPAEHPPVEGLQPAVCAPFGTVEDRETTPRLLEFRPFLKYPDNSVEIVKSDGRGGPNAIDPELFFSKDGRLWLVYGSFFAGIYIKELYASGENIGLPKEDGYGKLLWQGGDQGPEGPFIFYNPNTDYFYLMASHGSLSTNYNMRVARSKNPDGPYTDRAV